jgi:hypothetical protein
MAKDYSQKIHGHPDGFNSSVMNCILGRKDLKQLNEVSQYVQTIFMPDYENHLYEYYRFQQYLILLSFLSYPFVGLGSHVDPYIVAMREMDAIDVLDYGAGMPFGVIHLLRTCPEKIRSVTLVDLDLVHTLLVEHIIRALLPEINLVYHRMRDPNAIPDLGSRKYNFLYGKDIFEHLSEPGTVLRAVLSHANEECLCFFDFRDHGCRYLQHITPNLPHLAGMVTENRFQAVGQLGCMSGFWRGARQFGPLCPVAKG